MINTIPSPNVSRLKHDLDSAFHAHSTSNSDFLLVVMSSHGKRVYEATARQVPVFMPPTHIPDSWFDYYSKSLIMTNSTAQRLSINVDETGDYTLFICTGENEFHAITRTTSYQLKDDHVLMDLETMMVMTWENRNWYATGLLTVKPLFKHAIRTTWQCSIQQAYEKWVERSERQSRGVNESMAVALNLGINKEVVDCILYRD